MNPRLKKACPVYFIVITAVWYFLMYYNNEIRPFQSNEVLKHIGKSMIYAVVNMGAICYWIYKSKPQIKVVGNKDVKSGDG